MRELERLIGLRLASDRGPVTVPAGGVVFDCDGLIMDSEASWLAVIQEWIERYAPGLGASAATLRGWTAAAAARWLLDLTGRGGADHGELVATLNDRYAATLSAGVEPMPGAVAIIERLSSAKIPLAVASNGRGADVRAMLRYAGVLSRIDAVCAIEDVGAGKPAPDLYLKAVRALGVAPGAAVAFEDSGLGAQAARRAGLTVVGVQAERAVELDCDHRLASLDAVSIDTISEGVSGA